MIKLKSVRFSLLLLCSAFIFNFSGVFAQASVEQGEKIFKQNCTSCHSMGSTKVVGPGLKGVMSRVPSEDWLKTWIKNNVAMIKSGDAYANKIYEENNKAAMTTFNNLKDDEIASVIEYIKNPPAPKEAAAAANTPGGAAGAVQNDSMWNYVLIGLAALFTILIVVLGGVKKTLARLVRERDNLPEPIELPAIPAAKHWLRTHKKHVAVILLFLTCWGARAAWNGMLSLGVYTGYKPEQPIKFSHKIHAGQNAINCVYCHSGVEKSKVANVPSANVCMNCHKYIQQGPNTGKEEIAKIYAALDYNPETQVYGPNQKPIKWVRVHTLPDLVYFNHSQHVVVGKVECTTCHGPIAEMDTVRQFSPLTMGWCIECHRKTEVQMAGNPYYDKLHAKLAAEHKGEKITVSKMGGIECGKCHY
jgi:cytochrome c2